MGTNQSATRARDITQMDQVVEAAHYAAGQEGELELTTKLELSISCLELRKKANCRVSVYTRRGQDPNWLFAGNTESIPDTSEPEFIQSVLLEFSFEVQTRLRLELHNVLGTQKNAPHEFMGSTECFLAEVVAGRNGQIKRNLENHARPGPMGIMTITAEEVTRIHNAISMTIRCSGLPHEGFLGLPINPYAIIYRTSPSPDGLSEHVPVYRTEIRRSTCNPQWDKIDVTSQQLCRTDPLRPVEIEVWDKTQTGTHVFIGHCFLTYGDIVRAFETRKNLCYQLIDDRVPGQERKYRRRRIMSVSGLEIFKQDRSKRYKPEYRRHVGFVHIENLCVERKFTFLDYVVGGLEFNVIVAIDFTRSNGDPRSRDSLHQFNVQTPNDYVMAIRSVLEVLHHYDSDKMYPVYGFGARLPPSMTTISHCFSLKGDYFSPEVPQIEGILNSYRNALGSVTLHGPTRLSEVIGLASRWAEPYATIGGDDDNEEDEEEEKPTPRYFILLIITDGVIEDAQETIDEIVKASHFPLSVIIVGVGNEDFSQMKILDADETPLVSSLNGEKMARDIVQFVPFNDFKDKSYHELAIATLEEIPREVVNYFTSRRIYPRIGEARQNKLNAAAAKIGIPTGLMPKRLPSLTGGNAVSPKARKRNSLGKKKKETKAKAALNKIRESDYVMADFMMSERKALIESVASQGYNRDLVTRILDMGVPCVDPLHVIDLLFHYHRHKSSAAAAASSGGAGGGDDGGKRSSDIGPMMMFGKPRQSIFERTSQIPIPIMTNNGLSSIEDDASSSRKGHLMRRGTTRDSLASSIQMGPGACRVCFQRDIAVRLLDCGHELLCRSCAENLGPMCPLCKQTIKSIVTIVGGENVPMGNIDDD